jgi:hypothetical protein
MNRRVVFSLALAGAWLAAFAVVLVFVPRLRNPWGDDPQAGMIWLAFCILLLWNILRALLVWKPPRRGGPPDDLGR